MLFKKVQTVPVDGLGAQKELASYAATLEEPEKPLIVDAVTGSGFGTPNVLRKKSRS